MAKQVKAERRVIVPTWIVRDSRSAGSGYHVFVRPTAADLVPPNQKEGRSVWISKRGPLYGLPLCTRDYHASTEIENHLKPGGGPLKVKLVRA